MKHFFSGAVAFGVIASFSPCALAQQYTVPTDTELQAAYCFGYETKRHEWIPLSPNLKAFDQQHVDKLRDYLLSKGWMSPVRDQLPFAIAAKRGQRDWDACLAEVEQQRTSGQTDQCLRSPACVKAVEDSNYWEECADSCRPPSCKAGVTCRDLNLPF